MTTWIYVLLMLVLLCGSAFFSASEMALSSANRMRLASAAEEGNRAAGIACKVIDKYENALSAILIGNNLCNIGSDSIVTVLGIALLGEKYNGWVSVLITLCMTAIIIVFCESAPKIAAKKNANRFSMTVAPFVRFLMIVLSPVIFLVSLLIRLITLPLKDEHSGENTEEEAAAELQSIIETVEDEGVIDEDRSELLRSALDFSEIAVMDVMTARVDVEALDIDDDWRELLLSGEDLPYSRIPVYEDSIDNVIGFLYLNHFLKAMTENDRPDIRSLLMEPLYIYKTIKLPQVLTELRHAKKHLAIVTDEYGGTLGVISMEDVLEQIVGDIWDETDEVEDEIVERPDGMYEIDGDLPIGDLAELLDVTEESLDTASATAGGWTIEKFGAFPKVGDTVEADGLRVKVLAMGEDGLRVEKILVEKLPEDETDD